VTYQEGRRHLGHSMQGGGEVRCTLSLMDQSTHHRHHFLAVGSSPCQRRCCRGNDCAAPSSAAFSAAACIDQSHSNVRDLLT